MEALTTILRPAVSSDRTSLINLLQQVDLPTDDLPADLSGFVLAVEGEALVGSAGVQMLGETGLLRSVAVHPAFRNHKLGRLLVETALETAHANEIREVYLITTTADRYFERYGFVRVGREAVPEMITRTAQFSGLCPASAVVMKKRF